MPPKTKITKEMIIDAAFEIAQESGNEKVNARMVSGRLKCSMQPMMYCFSTVDELRGEVYKRASEFLTEYIMIPEAESMTMLDVGMAYVRFAAEEKKLFCLLF